MSGFDYLEEDIEELDNKDFCEYCGNSDPNCLVQCYEPHCRKWFCNCRISDSQGSQIIWHLTRSGHNAIRLSAHNTMKQLKMKLECFYCLDNNIFNLGFFYIPSGMPIPVCNKKCLEEKLREKPDLTFVYMIHDRRLINAVVADTTRKCSAIVNLAHMQEVERSLDQEFSMGDHMLANPRQYDDSDFYMGTMQTFVEVLKEHERYSNRNQIQTDVTIMWEHSKSGGSIGTYHKSDLITADFMPGLTLKITNRSWFSTEAKVKDFRGDLVVFGCKAQSTDLEDQLFDIQVIGNFITHDRLSEATMNFSNFNQEIKEIIMNPSGAQFAPDNYNIALPPESFLNESQKQAIVNAMTRPLSLIQGPPGTGKTYTSALIIYNYINSDMHDGPALVCASSNTATDNLAEKMLDFGLKVVRVISSVKELTPRLMDYSLDALASKMCSERNALRAEAQPDQDEESNDVNFEYEDIKPKPKPKPRRVRKTKRTGFLNDEPDKPANPRDFYAEVLQTADVVCCTCSSAGSMKMNDHLKTAKFVLIDEATQSIEPETLIPLSKKPLRVVLVGDQNQLGPTAMIKKCEQLGYYKSLFQRLIENGFGFTMLNAQYRMHPKLSLYPSKTFYNGQVQDGITAEARTLSKEFGQIWPNLEFPVVFHHIGRYEELNPTGLSYINRHEYKRLLDIINLLRQLGVDMKEVGLITPYEGQVAMIKHNFLQFTQEDPSLKFDEIQVSSIDGFQGKEKDFIIFSCVRSNKRSGIGFLNNKNRLNVALTRARKGLVLVGNAGVLMRDEVWSHYLEFLKYYKLIVDLSSDTDEFEDIMAMLQRKKKFGVTLLPMPEFTNECFDNAMMYDNIHGDLSKLKPAPVLDLDMLAKGGWTKTDLGNDLRRNQYAPRIPGRIEEETKTFRPYGRSAAVVSVQEEEKEKPISKFANLKVVRPGNTQAEEPIPGPSYQPARPRVNFKREGDRILSEELSFTLKTRFP